MPGADLNRTAQGWPYLDLDNFVDIVPAYTLDLATKLQNSEAATARAENAATRAEQAAAQVPRVAAGREALTVPTGTSGVTRAIVFPAGRFTLAPAIVATIESGSGSASVLNITTYSASTSGVSFRVSTSVSLASTVAIVVNWHAIQVG